MLLCYEYDPTTGKYGVAIMRHAPHGRRHHDGCARHVHVRDVPPRAADLQRRAVPTTRELSGGPIETFRTQMEPCDEGFRFFPTRPRRSRRTSTRCTCSCAAVTLFFTLLIFLLVVLLRLKYRRRHPDERPGRRSSRCARAASTRSSRSSSSWSSSSGRSKSTSRSTASRRSRSTSTSSASSGCGSSSTPTGSREINELHVPLSQRVQLTLASQDVIHSFFIPAFRVKQDAVPGRYTQMAFTPTKVGDVPPVLHRILRHGALRDDRPRRRDGAGRLPGVAHRHGRPTSRPPSSGRGCSSSLGCVDVPRRAGAEPGRRSSGARCTLSSRAAGDTVDADEHYLRESILDSTAKIVERLPADHAQLPRAAQRGAVDAPVAYIKSLRNAAGPADHRGRQPADEPRRRHARTHADSPRTGVATERDGTKYRTRKTRRAAAKKDVKTAALRGFLRRLATSRLSFERRSSH